MELLHLHWTPSQELWAGSPGMAPSARYRVLIWHKRAGKAAAGMMDAPGFSNWKKPLHIYKNQRLEKKQAGKNKRQVRLLNNWNPHENINLAFIQLGLSTSTYHWEIKSSSENIKGWTYQKFPCFVPFHLQQASVTQTILISIFFFTFFSD